MRPKRVLGLVEVECNQGCFSLGANTADSDCWKLECEEMVWFVDDRL